MGTTSIMLGSWALAQYFGKDTIESLGKAMGELA